MIDLETLIEESNPVALQTLPTSDSPQARSLFTVIVSEVAPLSTSPRQRRGYGASPTNVETSGRRVRSLAAAVIALALVGAGAALFAVTRSNRPGGGAPASWMLVGDITPATWSVAPGASYQAGSGLTCPTATTCLVKDYSSTAPGSDQVEITTDGGVTWRQMTLPAGLHLVGTLDCVNATTCAAFAQVGDADPPSFAFVSTGNGASAWTQHPVTLPATFTPNGISCLTATSCVAVFDGNGATGGGVSMATTDGGMAWTDAQAMAIEPLGIECFAGGACIVTGKGGIQEGQGAALYRANAEVAWSPATVPVGIGPVSSVACASPTTCLAITPAAAAGASLNVVIGTTDGGITWVTTGDNGLPVGAQPFTLACASGSMCWVGGSVVSAGITPQRIGVGQSLYAESTDNGQHWQVPSLATSVATGTVVGMSCPDATTCHAIEVLPDAPSSVLVSYGG